MSTTKEIKHLHYYIGNWTTKGLKLVTKVHYEEASVEWKENEAPVEMSLDEAVDIAYGLSQSFYRAVVVVSTIKIENQFFLNDKEDENEPF